MDNSFLLGSVVVIGFEPSDPFAYRAVDDPFRRDAFFRLQPISSMSTKSPVYCPVCNESIEDDENLEHHLVYEHKPRELAKRLVSEWEAEEFGDAM
ncbi:hypothetical protein CV102_09325 [Natronococcus pandeyae]|uniref:C2H2-type domain-containing protein n=2 Tax=Natronococcus pandeyae TaxID=2055836 RepID=A0A8J8TSE6_9EURY|nr:hypothetical protein CV102_09325 [Natronococcus pandeyae]